MVVRVILKSGLDKIIQKDVVACEINPGERVHDLLKHISFPAERAGIVLVDGIRKGKDCVLHGGEVIKIFPESFNTMAV